MAEIICIECKSRVSDASGYCPNCGYPFDIAPMAQNNIVAGDVHDTEQKTAVSPPPDVVLQSLDSIRQEMNGLQRMVADLAQNVSSLSIPSTDDSHKILAEITQKLDMIASATAAKGAAVQADASTKPKEKLLAAFYKTLNSPNSMFEYMFYICVVQIVFVIVNLFLVTYIVTLVR